MKSVFLRCYRLGIFLLMAWLLHVHQSQLNQQPAEPPDLSKVQAHLRRAAAFGKADDLGWTPVLTKSEVVLGYAKSTRPQSDRFVGYSGPSEALILLNHKRELLAVELLQSRETPEYVEKVKADETFWKSLSQPDEPNLVTGATLTSDSIRQGVQSALGMEVSSLKFPEPLTLEEIRPHLPAAHELRDTPHQPKWKEVLDVQGQRLAYAAVSSPEGESVLGYSGPTESLILLQPDDLKVLKVVVRKSYDTEEYVGYVTDDAFYLKSFSSYDLKQLRDLDFKEARLEGVTGATETSWAVAEALKRKAGTWDFEPYVSPWQRWWQALTWKDAGLAWMVLSGMLMMFTSLRGKRWYRRLHQTLLVAFVGLYAGALLSQSLMQGWAKHGVPWQQSSALVLLLGVAVLSPITARRQFYCHHFCPHGTLQQWLQKLSRWHLKIPNRWNQRLAILPSLLLVVGLALSFCQPQLNLSFLEPFEAWTLQLVGLGLTLFALITLLIAFFIPMAYCRFGCPTGALFKFLRYTGKSDQWNRSDTFALILVLLAAAYVWA